ncbi:MAG: hypothetical protein VXZ55_07990 [Planctomycetota bacterium]|nr:hypothetical protein [Planctomycetota bacterium]
MSPTSIAITLEVKMAELGRKPMSLNLRRGECCSQRFLFAGVSKSGFR